MHQYNKHHLLKLCIPISIPINTTHQITPFYHKSDDILKYMETALNFPVTGNLDSVIGIN